MEHAYATVEPTRAELDSRSGATLLEFGAPWCGWCRGAQALISEALQGAPGVEHIKIEDGSGRPLGRSYGVRLWPTLVFLRDGREVARVVRPQDAGAIRDGLQAITGG